MTAFNIVFPIFGLIFLGMLFRKRGWIKEEAFTQINSLLYWVAIPSLLFIKFAKLGSIAIDIEDFFLAFLGATLSAVALGYILALVLGLGRVKIGAFVQATYRGNLAFVGLPIALHYLTQSQAQRLEGLVFLSLSPMIITYNLLGVGLLVAHGEKSQGQIRKGLMKVATNPLILSCGFGLIFRMLELSLPLAIDRSLSILGQMVVPLALITVGGSVQFNRGEKQVHASFFAAAGKTMATPLLGLFFARWIGLGLEETLTLMLFLAAPTAAAAYILAKQLGSDAKMTANAILVGTLLSLISVMGIFAWAGTA